MRSHRALVVGAMLAALLPAEAVGQGAPAWKDSAQRLHALATALRDSMMRGDSTTQEVARSGSFVIAASPNNRTVAAEALTRFLETSDRWFGGAMPGPRGFRIVITTEVTAAGDFRTNRDVGAVVLAGLPDSGGAARVPRTLATGEVSDALIDAYGAMMFRSVVADTLWLHHTPSLSTPEVNRREVAMYALATGSGRAERDCAGGNLQQCALAFELAGSPTGDTGPLFPVFMRADLLFTALATGGPNAWARFRAAADSGIEPALVSAAGMPLDSLLSTWRAGLLALRPAEGPISTGTGVAALAWSALFLLGALGASRWA
jgi:hypothetical protein